MRRNFILSESEIRQLVKKTLLNEQETNSEIDNQTKNIGDKTIKDLQTLLVGKRFYEVGTIDNKAGQNTLSALNRALSLGLTIYRPQPNQQTTTPQKNIVKSPNNVEPPKINPQATDVKLTGDNTSQGGTQIITANQTNYDSNDLTKKPAPQIPAENGKPKSYSELKV